MSADSQKQTLFSPGIKSWALSLVAGVVIPLFLFPLLVEQVNLVISHIPLDVETGMVYGAGPETILAVVILLIVFMCYLTIVLYQVWLSATKTDFRLSIPVVLTITGPITVLLLLNLA